MNWRGRPLESHEVIVELIGATTQTGLRVRAELDRGRYPPGVRVRDTELAAVPLPRHAFHGEWNTACNQRQTSHHRRQASPGMTLEASR
jgi:Rhodopirellula transposase DDE domain